MGVWFELVTVGGSTFIVAHVNLLWLVVFFVLVLLWSMFIGGKHGRGGRY